jgi:hypothetical protein
MQILSISKTGLAVGAAVGGWHALWALLVLLGVGQQFLDYILRLHFMDLPLRVTPFDWSTAGALVGVTALLGFAGGVLFALAWNGLQMRSLGAPRTGPHAKGRS